MPTAVSLLSSFFGSRLRAVLWIAAGVAAVVLVVAVILGLRPHPAAAPSARRTLVAAYIERVGRIQAGMATQVRAIDTEYKAFARDPAKIGASVGRYRRAERTLAVLRHRLGQVHPPRDARRLHALLLQLADQNVLAARSVAAIAAYIPALTIQQSQLRKAIVALRVNVAKANAAKTQAPAFTAYAATTRSVAANVAKLRPPSFFVAAWNAELAQLRRLSSLASDIATALTSKQLAKAQKLLGDLGRTEADTSVLKAQRAGALVYNARLGRMKDLTKQIEVERQRLEKRVPA